MRLDFRRIEEHILPLVSRPGRYVGGEMYAHAKAHTAHRVSVLLAFPDVYEIGMSHLGLKILYHLVNRRDDALAEFTYAPWPDMEERMRASGIPLFSIQTRTPARDFDVFGISLQHELQYTNALNLLDLAGIPIRSEDRRPGDPLVVAGGPCCYNPEPMRPFFDAFAVGDGEDLLLDLVDVVGESKRRRTCRDKILDRVADIPGILVPGRGNDSRAEPVQARAVKRLDRSSYPSSPPVPLMDIAHNRLGVEIMRGCTRGCRFCQAGMIGRPLREMEEDDVVGLAVDGVSSGGWDEVTLISLSSLDYSRIGSLVARLTGVMESRRVAVCLPSLRPGGLTEGIARGISRFRHPGLTFAPEAGTDRLRNVINKQFDEEALLESARIACRHGWRQIKLYFMVGLPTEREEDLEGMASLAGRISRVKEEGRSLSVKMSASPFVPKAQTPFQWERQAGLDEVMEKIRFLKGNLPGKRIHLRWPLLEMPVVEGILARGDRRLGGVVESVWRDGARFEGWTDFFSFERWERGLAEAGLSCDEFLRARTPKESLPWNSVSSGVTEDYLLAERERAHRAEFSPDCREQGCRGCFSADLLPMCREITLRSDGTSEETAFSLPARRSGGGHREEPRFTVRVRYAKGEGVRFTSHLDVVRMFDRAIRRSALPVAYTAGFSPRPRLVFGPPLRLGMTSQAEYADLQMLRPWREDDGRLLAKALPRGMEIMGARGFAGKAIPLSRPGSRDRYRARFAQALSVLDPVPDSEEWWNRLREKCISTGPDATAAGGAPNDRTARILSLSVESDDAETWSLHLEFLTGPGQRRVLDGLLADLLGDGQVVPLVRMERLAYDLWQGDGWVPPLG